MDIVTLALSKKYTNTRLAELATSGFTPIMVDTLPEIEDADTGSVYLVPAEEQTDENKYLEYLVVAGKWECIGTTAIDLSDYVQQSALNDYYTKANVNSLLNNKQDKFSLGRNVFMYNNELSSVPVCGLAAETTSYHEMFRYSSNIKNTTGHNGTIAAIYSNKLYVMHECNRYGGAFTPSSYTINSSFTGSFKGMKYGNDKYLILTDFSKPTYGFFYTRDLTYNKVSFSYYAVPENLTGLTFNNLQFIHDRFFIWNTTQMFYSFDGKDWTEINVPGEGDIVDVIAKDLDFCIIRTNTLNITSDLINFETHETTQVFSQYKTVFFKGKLFKNHPDASSLSLLYTTDYEKWYTTNLNISRYCGNLFTDNDLLYVSGNGLTSDFWYSRDGLNFSLYTTTKSTNSGQFFSTGTMVCLFGGDEIQRGILVRIINTKQHPVTTVDNVLYTPRQSLTDKLDEISSKSATKDYVDEVVSNAVDEAGQVFANYYTKEEVEQLIAQAVAAALGTTEAALDEIIEGGE